MMLELRKKSSSNNNNNNFNMMFYTDAKEDDNVDNTDHATTSSHIMNNIRAKLFFIVIMFMIIMSVGILITNNNDMAITTTRVTTPTTTTNNHDILTATASTTNVTTATMYLPSYIEQYVIDYGIKLGLDKKYVYWLFSPSSSCNIINDVKASDIYDDIQVYMKELDTYNQFVQNFSLPNSNNMSIRKQLQEIQKQKNTFYINEIDQEKICSPLKSPIYHHKNNHVHNNNSPQNETRIMEENNMDTNTNTATSTDHNLPNNSSSSLISYSINHGYIEPLLPPLRHLSFCQDRYSLMRMDYMIHDFYHMCKKQMKPTSQIILIDIGASLSFHDHTAIGNKGTDHPATYLISLYEKFGFTFDHIYAYEITKQNPNYVYNMIPESLLSSYHWYNVGVSSNIHSPLNPYNIIKNHYNENDIIIIKLDIDTPTIELALTMQILNDEQLLKYVNHFYFEHHVQLKELKLHWGSGVNGTILDSLNLFQSIRKHGIASHYWP